MMSWIGGSPYARTHCHTLISTAGMSIDFCPGVWEPAVLVLEQMVSVQLEPNMICAMTKRRMGQGCLDKHVLRGIRNSCVVARADNCNGLSDQFTKYGVHFALTYILNTTFWKLALKPCVKPPT